MASNVGNALASKHRNVRLSAKRQYQLPITLDPSVVDLADCNNVGATVSGSRFFALPSMQEAGFGQEVTQLLGSVGEFLYFCGVDGVYAFNTQNNVSTLVLQTDGSPLCATTYRSNFFVSINGLGTYRFSRANCYEVCPTRFCSMAAVGERIFAVHNNKLYYTEITDSVADLAFNDTIKLPTSDNAIQLAVLDGTLYLIGATDVFCLDTNASEGLIRVCKVLSGVGTALPFSVATVGDRAYFATSGGIFTLKNKVLRRFCSNLDGYVDYNTARGITLGKHYLLCAKTVGEQVRSVALWLSTMRAGNVYGNVTNNVVGVYSNLNELCVVDNRLYANSHGQLLFAQLDEQSQDGQCCVCWKNVNFGAPGPKYLCGVTVVANCSVTVSASATNSPMQQTFNCLLQCQHSGGNAVEGRLQGYAQNFSIQLHWVGGSVVSATLAAHAYNK